MAAPKKRRLIVIAVIILVAAIILSSFVYLNAQKPYTGNIEPVTLGVYPSEYSSLIYIANDQQYFSANGLKITIKNYTSGSAAAKGMLNGEVDVATASEFVVASNAMNNASIYAFGSVSKYLNLYIVARTDKGINNVADLTGKKIGLSLGTGNQFYLGRYLELNGINQDQVTLVNVNFVQTPEALANGTIDAAITFQPYINQIQSLLGNRVRRLSIGQSSTAKQRQESRHSSFRKKLIRARLFFRRESKLARMRQPENSTTNWRRWGPKLYFRQST